jgi:sensor histidine kinase YesM
VAPKVGKSRILVQAQRRGERILLTVEDDGIGLTQKHAKAEFPGGADRGGVGLQNIRERLQTMYGSTARLSLASIQSGGSRATLELPVGE